MHTVPRELLPKQIDVLKPTVRERMNCAAFRHSKQENAAMAQDMSPTTKPAGTGNIGTPLQALRSFCLECCNGSFNEVRLCPVQSCPLWLLRNNRNPTAAERAAVAGQPVRPLERNLVGTSGLKAIKRKCLDCSGGTDAGVRSCTFNACPLFGFRAGKNPNITRTPERKEADAMRLAALRVSALSKRPAGNPQCEPAADPAGVLPRETIVAAE